MFLSFVTLGGVEPPGAWMGCGLLAGPHPGVWWSRSRKIIIKLISKIIKAVHRFVVPYFLLIFL